MNDEKYEDKYIDFVECIMKELEFKLRQYKFDRKHHGLISHNVKVETLEASRILNEAIIKMFDSE